MASGHFCYERPSASVVQQAAVGPIVLLALFGGTAGMADRTTGACSRAQEVLIVGGARVIVALQLRWSGVLAWLHSLWHGL